MLLPKSHTLYPPLCTRQSRSTTSVDSGQFSKSLLELPIGGEHILEVCLGIENMVDLLEPVFAMPVPLLRTPPWPPWNLVRGRSRKNNVHKLTLQLLPCAACTHTREVVRVAQLLLVSRPTSTKHLWRHLLRPLAPNATHHFTPILANRHTIMCLAKMCSKSRTDPILGRDALRTTCWRLPAVSKTQSTMLGR